jgi:DNA-binding MarR family transcriptional regulator
MREGPRSRPSTLGQPLKPPAHASLVVPIGVAEPPFQVRLFTRDREAMAARRKMGTAPRRGAGPIVDSKAEAIAELMLEVAQCFFRIRAIGQKTGLITSWGGGAFGFMRSLALLGPLTVPQIAQMRPTSRQRMQRLADELAAEGLVKFVDNPKHRRSKLVQLTPKGDVRYRELNARFLTIASTMGVALTEADIRKTTEIVRQLSDDVKARSERLS